MTRNRKIVLAQRPTGQVKESDLRYTEDTLAPLQPGQVRLKNRYISLDPATRGWMDDKASYMQPIPIGGVMLSAGVGEVIESQHPDWQVGDIVSALFGWEEISTFGERELKMGRRAGKYDLPLSYELGALGGNGLTAYIGLHRVAQIRAGETVVISAASGGVGSVAGQLAKIAGCRVVGITGGSEKARMLIQDLGFDAAINYKAGNLYQDLKAACPKGVDVYFDNVGGDILDTVLTRINVHARVVLCGAISQINATSLPPGPKNYIRLLARRAKMEGFITLDYAREWVQISDAIAAYILNDQLQVLEEVVDGLEAVPNAFARLFKGEKIGKLVVKVS